MQLTGTILHFSAFNKMNSQELLSKYGGQDYYTLVHASIN